MVKSIKNWLDSAEYDLVTAKSLFNARRKVYVIFMCHLTLEKLLKAVYLAKFNKLAPYTHNLVYLVNLLELSIPLKFTKFVELINDKSVPIRYPENISELERKFSLKLTKEYLVMTEALVKWLKQNIIYLK